MELKQTNLQGDGCNFLPIQEMPTLYFKKSHNKLFSWQEWRAVAHGCLGPTPMQFLDDSTIVDI